MTLIIAMDGRPQMFSIEVVRGYKLELFREDLKRLYDLTGVQQENTIFLFTDTQATRAPALIACSSHDHGMVPWPHPTDNAPSSLQ